jgi:hypothetical protein
MIHDNIFFLSGMIVLVISGLLFILSLGIFGTSAAKLGWRYGWILLVLSFALIIFGLGRGT